MSRPWKMPRQFLLALSDQQIITGIGIQSVGLAKMPSMVPYHFFIIWMLSILSTATHLATLLALVADFRRDWVIRWMRQGLMLVNLILSCAFGVIVLESIMKMLPQTLPIACVWNSSAPESKVSVSNPALSVVATIAVIAGQLLVFVLGTIYLHSNKNPRWLKPMRVLGLVFLVAIAIGASTRVFFLSQAFGHPNVSLNSEKEKQWSFGQLLPLLLLLLPLNSMVEMLRGEMKVPNPVPLYDGQGGLPEDESSWSRTELLQR